MKMMYGAFLSSILPTFLRNFGLGIDARCRVHFGMERTKASMLSGYPGARAQNRKAKVDRQLPGRVAVCP